MIKATLPSFLRHKAASGLVRLGSKNDGGYIVARNDIKETDILISLGVSFNWSFESEFVKRNKCPVLAYDASVNERAFFNRLLEAIKTIYTPRFFAVTLYKFIWYYVFFSGPRRHIRKFVGLGQPSDQFVTMDEVFHETKSTRIFLKIDIEGHEYDALDSIVANQDRLTGLTIEFHDCDVHIARIEQFVSALHLQILHIHANNYTPPKTSGGLPLTLEVTFSKYAEFTDEPCRYPHDLDRPCNPLADEILISF